MMGPVQRGTRRFLVEAGDVSAWRFLALTYNVRPCALDAILSRTNFACCTAKQFSLLGVSPLDGHEGRFGSVTQDLDAPVSYQ